MTQLHLKENMSKKISNVALLTFEGAAKKKCPKNMSKLSGVQHFFVTL
jgi:hypothetical protein